MQAMESAFDVCTEDLFNQTVKLEEMEKKAGNAEGDVSSLRSRLILLQENNEKQEDRLAKATLELVGANMQQLEIGEEKTIAREEGSQNEILELMYKLKRSEYRGEQAEMNIQRLNVRIDQVEEDLLNEKYKIKKISDDLNQTFEDMINMAV